MIEKFNFYDVYGYFLPGLALIGVLWFPIGMATHAWPKADWGSALSAVVAAYLLGHLMLYVSTKVVPSYDVKKSTPEQDRYPSATVMDKDSSDLSSDLREKIARAVNGQFNLNLHTEDCTGQFDAVRNDAFFLARHALIRDKEASYAEQFEGMYSLARGLAVAFAVAVAYYLGWVLSTLRWPFCRQTMAALALLSVLVMLNVAIRLWSEDNQEHQRKEDRKNLSEEKKKDLQRKDRRRKRTLEQVFCRCHARWLFFRGVSHRLGL